MPKENVVGPLRVFERRPVPLRPDLDPGPLPPAAPGHGEVRVVGEGLPADLQRPAEGLALDLRTRRLGLAIFFLFLAKLANILLANFPKSLQFFGGLVLGCIKTKVCNKIYV